MRHCLGLMLSCEVICLSTRVLVPSSYVTLLFVFFFQAEDGIRDKLVTGVQTCALPIWLKLRVPAENRAVQTAGDTRRP